MRIRVFIFAVLLFVFITNISAQEREAKAEKLFAEAETLRVAKDAESRRKAIVKYDEAIVIFQELNLRKREADAFNNIGYIYKNLGEFEKSLGFFKTSLEINREIGNKKGIFSALLNAGQSFRYLNRTEEAAANVNEALAISREMNDKEKEAAALNELGVLYYTSGEIRKCLEPFEVSVSIFESLDKKLPQASLLNNLGLINRLLGNQEDAIEKYKKALAIFRAEKKRDGEADVLLNLSAAYSDMFRAVEAMEYFNLALEIFRESGNRQRESVVLNNIGVFYNNLGDYSKAFDYYKQSGEIAEQIGNRRQYASALKNIGIVQLNLNDLDKSLASLNLALSLSREVKNRLDEGWILNNIGLVYDKKGDYEKAKEFMQKSLEILREIGNREGEANTLYNLGSVLEKTNENQTALENYKQALKIRRELLTPGEEGKILLGIARVERDSGDLQAAQNNIEQAIERIESLRTGIPGQDLRTAFFALGKDAYDFQINLLMQANEENASPNLVAKAFDLSERSRARSLLESLFESRTEIRQGVDEKLLERKIKLQNQLNAAERYRLNILNGKPNTKKLTAVEKEIRSLLNEYQEVRAEIEINNPMYSALIQLPPLTLKEIQQTVLDRDTILLEYSLGEENSYLWMVTKDSVKSRTLPKRDEITVAARRFYKSLNARNNFSENETEAEREIRFKANEKEVDDAARNLSAMIFPFDMSELGNKRLLIVTEGILQYVPFGALKVQSSKSKVQSANADYKYLIENHEIVYLPSASTLTVLRKKEKRKTMTKNLVAVLADPVFSTDDVRYKTLAKKSPKNDSEDLNSQVALVKSKLRSDFSRLRFSRREAEAISSLVSDEQKFVALDFAASRKSIGDERFNKSRIVHFATHGIISSEFPELSGIVLSLIDENGDLQDGFLRLHDIYNLRLDADLVVLSACDTALGKEIRGEGIVGLTRGFMYAGASDVVASLWKVDDRATADLMKRFYQYLLKENLHPADALRKAKISMIKEKPTQNPYYWAAFVLQGDWK